MSGVRGTVYLLHFDKPHQHARHYIGWAQDLEGRLKHHAAGSGAKLTGAAAKAGVKWVVARTWENADRNFERVLKRKKAAPTLCSVCSAKPVDINP